MVMWYRALWETWQKAFGSHVGKSWCLGWLRKWPRPHIEKLRLFWSSQQSHWFHRNWQMHLYWLCFSMLFHAFIYAYLCFSVLFCAFLCFDMFLYALICFCMLLYAIVCFDMLMLLYCWICFSMLLYAFLWFYMLWYVYAFLCFSMLL